MSAGLDQPGVEVATKAEAPEGGAEDRLSISRWVTPTRRQQLRRPLFPVVFGVLALVLVTAFYEVVIVDLLHSQRHDHLVADFAVNRPELTEGSAVAALQIPKIKMNEVVIQGDSVENLRAGPAHRSSTPLPGQKGNSVLLGHNRRYGATFGELDRLAKGDEVFVQVRNEPAVRFVVATAAQVDADDTVSLGRTDDTRVTLVTSAGGYLSTDRRVVVAVATGDQAPAPSGIGGSFNPRRPSFLFNSMLGLAYLAVAAAVVGFTWLRRRHRLLVTGLAVAPFVILAALAFALNLDFLLPATT